MIIRLRVDRYPIDILLFMLYSVIFFFTALFNIDPLLETVLGIPFLLFIPGYVLVFTLFPTKKTEKGINIEERIILSISLSIAVISLIGLGLNYTSFGIKLESILFSIFIFIILVGCLGCCRWFRVTPEKRYIISLALPLKKTDQLIDTALTFILIVSILLTVTFLVYAIVNVQDAERFTSFYIRGAQGNALNYPRILQIGENATVTLGIENHEHRIIDYTIEIWLINQTTEYNQSINKTYVVNHNMWFMDKIEITLKPIPVNIEKSWIPQWEQDYTFNISKKGDNFKLAFLLFTHPTKDYQHNVDYVDIIEDRLNNAYRELHLWITVV